MFASDESEKVISYLNHVLDGNIPELNYSFAKEVAQKVKLKIENEKKVHISVA